MIHVPDPGRPSLQAAGPSPLDTAEFSHEEILERLEMGRLIVKSTGEGSRLEVAHIAAPGTERRSAAESGLTAEQERRRYRPLDIPTLFPESGPILVLLVGGFADDGALRAKTPFHDQAPHRSALIWQALSRAGLLHRKDAAGSGDDASPLHSPPRTRGVAMTYAGYRRQGEVADFERIIHPWNLHRLQTLIQACWDRSMGGLKIITIGEAARFMMCACVYGMPDIAVLSLPDPTPEGLAWSKSAASDWVEWAADLMVVGRNLEL